MHFMCHHNEFGVSDERIESGMEFQTVGAATWKERD